MFECRGNIIIDSTVRNAARIARVGGTWNRKGDSIDDRQHRKSVLYPPDPECPVQVIPIEMIEEIASLAPIKQQSTQSKQSPNGTTSTRLNVPLSGKAKGITNKTKGYRWRDCIRHSMPVQ